MLGDEVVVQQDGARPQVGHNVLQCLEDAGNDGHRPRTGMRAQPVQSPYTNKADLSIVESCCKRTQVWKGDQKLYEPLRDALYRAYAE